jgi:hypothetical protein
MTQLRGHVEKDSSSWTKRAPDGTEVTISFARLRLIAQPRKESPRYTSGSSRLSKGAVSSVDASLNKRHYLYGHPKA